MADEYADDFVLEGSSEIIGIQWGFDRSADDDSEVAAGTTVAVEAAAELDKLLDVLCPSVV